MSHEIAGIGVSPGRVAGKVVRMPDPIPEPPAGATLTQVETVEASVERITRAGQQVKWDLEDAASRASGQSKEVLEATAMMASDPSLAKAAAKLVQDKGLTPERAIWEAAQAVSDQLAAMGGYMAERVRDIADVRNRLIAWLTGRPAPGVPDREEPFILVARDLAPADTATLDPKRVIGILTSDGGPTSHTAILARAIGMPAIVGAAQATELAEGTTILINGATGVVRVDPTDEEIAIAAKSAGEARTFDGDGRTSDGHKVLLLANVGEPKGAKGAADAGAQGVGLFRSEFCFLDREDAPTIEEQVAQYRMVFSAFPGKKVVIRTLDAGADKPLPFLTNTDEPNPALGVRGLRTSWRNPEVLEDQLAAIALAAAEETADVWVMAPMVATVAETETFVAACHKHGLQTAGVMVEVPSAALLSGPILQRAAFASIGTNDLTQYAMASDRLLGELAELSDAWQPAVLQLIAATCRGGEANGKPVGVCGEAAANPALAVVLVGLGVASLSMTARALPDVAAVLAATSYDECVRLAHIAVSAESAAAAKTLVRAELPILEELGL